MSYYTLPKKIVDFEIEPALVNADNLNIFISYSLFNYLNAMSEQTKKIETSDMFFSSTEDDNVLHFLNKVINPYEFIFTKVPNSKLSVSKLKPFSNLFYILMEIVSIFNLLDGFADRNINTCSYGVNSNSVVEFMNMLREDNNDINLQSSINMQHIRKSGCKINEYFREVTYDFLYYELDNNYYSDNNYVIGMIYILCNLFCQQSANGVAIIKIDNIFYKPIVDILYILSSIYDKVYIIKPTISNMITSERYVICKNFIFNSQKAKLYYMYFVNLDLLLKTVKDNERIASILKEEIPYYFINKLEESNIIIGHQQIEFIDQLISLYKNKNREDKIETLKKNNIQKCIQWCDKFKIPYNKFTDKVNIFLNGEKSFSENSENPSLNIFLSTKPILEVCNEGCENVVIIDDNCTENVDEVDFLDNL